MLIAQTIANADTATLLGGGGLAALIAKWLFLDLRDQRKEADSRKVREDNLILQTDLLRDIAEGQKKIAKEKRKANKSSRKNHRRTHELLREFAGLDKQ